MTRSWTTPPTCCPIRRPRAGWPHRLHSYYGDPSAQTRLHERFPAQDIYFTGCSGVRSDDPTATFSDTLKWHARNLVIGTTRNWSRTVVNWSLALDPAGGPHIGGGECRRVRWSTPVDGAGSGQITTIGLPDRPLRQVRVRWIAAAANWRSVADVRAYR